MTRRRGHGDGGIRRRSDGRWEASIDLGRARGRRRRRFFYGRTRAEAAAKLRAAQASLDAGLPLLDQSTRLGPFLDTWLAEVVAPARQGATWRGYEANVRLHI